MTCRFFQTSALLFTLLSCPSLFAGNIEKLTADDWIHITSPNFDITTDLDEEKGKNLIENLENYRYFSINMMGLRVVPDIKPLKILAISSNSNFKKLGLP